MKGSNDGQSLPLLRSLPVSTIYRAEREAEASRLSFRDPPNDG
jgi:hypothetical protein